MLATNETLIQKTPNVMGGEACIRRTRIAVWILVAHRRMGEDDERLIYNFQGLTPQDLVAAWDYHAANREEIEDAIQRNEEA